jgi:hypothetical protein
VAADPEARGATVVWRTATSTDYLNPDGTHTMAISSGPVNFRSSSGEWQPMDPTLVHGPKGRLVERVGRAGLDAAETSSSSADLLGLSGSGWSASVGLGGGSGGVAGVLRGASVEYDNLAPGVDLQVALGSSTAEALLIVHQPGTSTWDLSVSATGSSLQAQPDGTVVLVSHGQDVATFSGGIAQDSAASPANTPVSLSLISPTVLRVSIDSSWLSDPSRVFPVSVDPTVQLGPPATGEYDAYAQQNTPTTNYNGAAQYNSSLGAYVDVAGYTTYSSVQEYAFQHFEYQLWPASWCWEPSGRTGCTPSRGRTLRSRSGRPAGRGQRRASPGTPCPGITARPGSTRPPRPRGTGCMSAAPAPATGAATP